MNWTPLRSQEELEKLIFLSKDQPQVIFKHSTRCSISSVAKNRLEKQLRRMKLFFIISIYSLIVRYQIPLQSHLLLSINRHKY